MMKTEFFYRVERSRINKKGLCPLNLSLRYGYGAEENSNGNIGYPYFTIATGFSIKPDENTMVDKLKYTNVNGQSISTVISIYKDVITEQLTVYRAVNKRLPHPVELKSIVVNELVEQGVKKKRRDYTPISNENTIVGFIDKLVNDNKNLPASAKNKLSESTLKGYTTIQKQLKDFAKHKNKPDYKIRDFNKNLLLDFLNYLNEEQKEENGYGYTLNTYTKKVDNFKALMRRAKRKGLEIGLNLDDEDLMFGKTKASDGDVFLTETHLERIINAPTLRIPRFELAKDYLIVGAFTSLRFGDMSELHNVSIEEVTDTYNNKTTTYKGFQTPIRKVSSATNEVEVFIPILKPVADVLARNSGKFPMFPKEPLMNRYIKEFAEHIGFKEMVEIKNNYVFVDTAIKEQKPLYKILKPHSTRSTFISNMQKLGVPNEYYEYITHPVVSGRSVTEKHYMRSTAKDRTNVLVRSLLKHNGSSLYQLA